jgi:hypothetical protein
MSRTKTSNSREMYVEYNFEAGAWDIHSAEERINNAIPFSQRLNEAYAGFDHLTDQLFKLIWADSRINKIRAKQRTLRRVLRNLYFAHIHRTALIVSMDINTYSRNGRKQHNVDSYRDMKRIFDYLHERGFVNRKVGTKFTGRATRYWVIRDAHIGVLFEEWQRTGEVILSVEDLKELIVMKDAEKRTIQIRAIDEDLRKEEDKIRAYNGLIKQTCLGLQTGEDTRRYGILRHSEGPSRWQQDGEYVQVSTADRRQVQRVTIPPLYMHTISHFINARPSCCSDYLRQVLGLLAMMLIHGMNQLQRKFNNSTFTDGGRFYWSPVQSLPKDLRARLTINGESVVEHDYSCFHPSILYHRRGLDVPERPYLFEDNDTLRCLAKVLLNTLINADSYQQALISVCKSLCDDAKFKGMADALAHSRFAASCSGLSPKKMRYASVLALYLELRAYHIPIQEDLTSGAGIKLQRIDSDIASEIMWHFTQQGIPLLPVHDSFIIAERHSDELKAVMAKAYFRRFKRPITIK